MMNLRNTIKHNTIIDSLAKIDYLVFIRTIKMIQIKKNKMIEFVENSRRIGRKWFSAIQDFECTGNNRLKKYFHVYMAVKVFLIILATCSITILFLIPAFQRFVEDASRPKVLLFTSPVIFVILFKLYFIGMILLTFDRSKHIFQLAIKNMMREREKILLKLREAAPFGLRHVYGKLVRYR
ncbi:MAG: hypothetical protein E3K37_10755 [Candidatus Kuenenia sp.]|nr:hypothetical protein [Candidatus Kuenenia hertensis]